MKTDLAYFCDPPFPAARASSACTLLARRRGASSATRPGPDWGLQLFDHGSIQTPAQAQRYARGLLCLPGLPPENVAIRFARFQFNTLQDRMDAVLQGAAPGSLRRWRILCQRV